MTSFSCRNKRCPCKKETDHRETDESAANSENFASTGEINSEFRSNFFTTLFTFKEKSRDKNIPDDKVDDMDYDGFLNYR